MFTQTAENYTPPFGIIAEGLVYPGASFPGRRPPLRGGFERHQHDAGERPPRGGGQGREKRQAAARPAPVQKPNRVPPGAPRTHPSKAGPTSRWQ